ncbi:type II toxin-antitoxin system VapC family toxin [Sphingomonas sp. LT1P40]|uniref:type II toxin-antitoxin system VapC family toxin n=1 Tax=Alteristakelama amylovorans TaxID=3096166 RepID=UPI002FCAC15E
MIFVLDTSAILALLLDEPGTAMVAEVVRGSELSAVNHCEVMSKIAENGADRDETHQILLDYGIRIRAFREEHALEAARLRPLTSHLGLSLGDRACLAQGHFSDRPILTADRRMAEADVGLDIRMIR